MEGTSIEAETFDQRITFQQVLGRLRDTDVDRVARAIIQMGGLHERDEVDQLLIAIWKRDRGRHPDLNWDALDTPSVRISVARVLGRWHPDEPRYHDYLHAMSGEGHDMRRRVDALVALGSLGREEDLERLRSIAISQDEMLATGALIGLMTSNKESAIRTVEEIVADGDLPAERRSFAGKLLTMPRPRP